MNVHFVFVSFWLLLGCVGFLIGGSVWAVSGLALGLLITIVLYILANSD